MSGRVNDAQNAGRKFYTIGTLFSGSEGLKWFDRNVTRKIQTLPGFEGLTKITDAIAQIQIEQTPEGV